MIDLTKPIRTKQGKLPARVLAMDIGDDWPIAIACEKPQGEWGVNLYTEAHAELYFENIPPEPATGVVYVWWKDGMVFGATAYPHDAQVWRDRGGAVSEHMVTEPRP